LQKQAFLDENVDLVKVNSGMTYEEAKGMLHDHILSLDI